MRLAPVGDVVGSYDPRDGRWVAGCLDGCCGGAAACAEEPAVKGEHAAEGSAGERRVFPKKRSNIVKSSLNGGYKPLHFFQT